MPIISNYDFEWHENPVIVSLLKGRPLARQELYERLHDVQKHKETPIGRVEPHCKGAYRYWIRHLKAHGILTEDNKILSLTPLGKWVANSSLGTVFERERFSSLTCSKCSKSSGIVLLKPLLNTMEVNASGSPFLDFVCPACGNRSERCNVSGIANKDSFVSFYNQAAAELRGLAATKA
jgi:hypothetical protein